MTNQYVAWEGSDNAERREQMKCPFQNDGKAESAQGVMENRRLKMKTKVFCGKQTGNRSKAGLYLLLATCFLLLGLVACEEPTDSDVGGTRLSGLYRVLLVSVANGGIEVSPQAALSTGLGAGSEVSLIVRANRGYHLRALTLNDAALGEPYQFTLGAADAVVFAEFERVVEQSIASAEDLVKIGNDPMYPMDGAYILGADIRLPDGAPWAPIGTWGKGFSGSFDGGGKKISNLQLQGGDALYTGFFGYTGSALIENLTLELSDTGITLDAAQSKYIGAVAGFAYGTTMNNITVTVAEGGDFSVTGTGGGALYAGGFAGYQYYSEFSALTFDAPLAAENAGSVYAGGIAGWTGNYSGVRDCTVSGSVAAEITAGATGATYAGGIAGYAEASVLSFSGSGEDYSVSGDVSALGSGSGVQVATLKSTYAGGIAGYLSATALYGGPRTAGAVSAVNAGTGTFGQIYAGGIAGDAVESPIEGAFSAGTVTAGRSTSNGTGNDRETGVYNIYAGGIAGHTDARSPVNRSESAGATVSATRGGTVERGILYAGGIVGHAESGITYSISSATVKAERADSGTATTTQSDVYAGGIIGLAGASIAFTRNSSTGATVEALSGANSSGTHLLFAGGVVGNAPSSVAISFCSARADVTAASETTATSNVRVCAGGIAGNFNGNLSNCYSTGNVSASSKSTYIAVTTNSLVAAGGIVGYGGSATNITNCYALGSVSASRNSSVSAATQIYSGGIAGYTTSTASASCHIENCAALSPSITVAGTATETNLRINRISGRTGTIANYQFVNNIAVTPNPYTKTLNSNTSTPAITDSRTGADAVDGGTVAAINAATFFNTAATDGLGWSNSVWQWTGEAARPVKFVWEE